MTQLEYLVAALKNLGGKALYSKIYEEFERLTNTVLIPERKVCISKEY